jgi:hypothetical protein
MVNFAFDLWFSPWILSWEALMITLLWFGLVRRGVNERMMPPDTLRYMDRKPSNDNLPDHVKPKRRWF